MGTGSEMATPADFTRDDLIALWFERPPRAGLPEPTDDNATLFADLMIRELCTHGTPVPDYCINSAYRQLVESNNKT